MLIKDAPRYEQVPLEGTHIVPREGQTLASVLYIVRDGKVLLAEKARGWAKGVLGGPGGKFDPERGDVSLIDTFRAELEEESGIRARGGVMLRAMIEYSGAGYGDNQMTVGYGVVHDYEGEITDSDEMVNHDWFPQDGEAMPWNRMHPDNEYWLDSVLHEERLYSAKIHKITENGHLAFTAVEPEYFGITAVPLVGS